MRFGSDASPVVAGGNVLKFPRSPDSRRRGWATIWHNVRSALKAHGKAHGVALGVMAIACAAISVGLWSFSAASTPRYSTAPVTRGPILRTVTVTGTVNPAQTVLIGARVSGTIQSLDCDYSGEVQAGQVCAKIDPRTYQTALDQYSGQLLRDRAILEKDRDDLARLRKHSVGNPFMRRQADDQTLLVSRDEGTVKLDQALVDTAKLNLAYTDVVMPSAGTVVARNVNIGQAVSANSPALFQISTDPRHVDVTIGAVHNEIGAIKVGDKAVVTVDALPDRTFSGTVRQIHRAPDAVQSAATYEAVVTVENSDLVLKPGMTATAQVVVGERADALRVPDQALRFVPTSIKADAEPAKGPAQKGQAQIWLLRGGAPVALNVVAGLDAAGVVEIAPGDLNPGDQVITGENRPQSNGAQSGQAGAP